MGLEDAPLGTVADQADSLAPSAEDVKAEHLDTAQAHLDKEEQYMGLARLQQAYALPGSVADRFRK